MRGRAATRPAGLLAAVLVFCLASWAGAQPTSEAQLDRISDALSRGEYTAAEQALRQLATPSPRADYLRGFALIQLYRYEEAEATLRRAVASQPDNHVWLEALAKALIEQSKSLAAIEVLDRALAIEPRPQYHFAKAMGALNTGDLQTAESALRSCLAAAPRHAEALYKLGRLLVDRGEYGPGLEPLRTSLELAPDNTEARFLLGLAASRTGEPAAAAEAFAAVLERVPGHVGALYNLGRVLLTLGRREEGLARLEEFRALSPLQDRIEYYDRAVRKNADHLGVRLELAGLLLEAGKSQDALDELMAARQLDPASVEAYRLMARAFERLGQSDNASRAAAFARRLEQGGR